MTILLKLFHKVEAERTLHNSIDEATITLKRKPHENPTKKKENYRPISTMSIDEKHSIKYLQI